MEKKKQKFNIKTLLFSLILVFSILFSSFSFNLTTYASTTVPEVPGGGIVDTTDPSYMLSNNSLVFGNLKEEDSSVYIYVFQKLTDDIYATSINISTSLEKLSFKNYKLEFVSKTTELGPYGFNMYLYKYLVKDLEISTNNKRVYEISCIYRLFMDGDISYKYDEYENTTTEKAFAVEKCYTYLTNEDGTTSVSVLETETIYVTDKFVGFVRYKGGSFLYPGSCDAHFVAFSTDKQIDTLREADVYYTAQSYEWNQTTLGGVKETYGEKIDSYSYLTDGNYKVYDDGFIYKRTYFLKEISTTSEFIDNLDSELIYSKGSFDDSTESNILDSLSNNLSGKTHVLMFATTDYTKNTGGSTGSTIKKTIVGDVAILRLKFETGGTLFEYGVVDDKTTGSTDPVISVGSSSPFDPITTFIEWLKNLFSNIKIVLIVLLIAILFILFFPAIMSILPLLIKFIVSILKLILNIFLFILKLPLTIINLFRGKR